MSVGRDLLCHRLFVSVISSMRLYMDSLVIDYWFESFDMKIVI